MPTGVAASRRFRSLSVRDLIEAREAYHVHLAHLNRVVATAIGLYRRRTAKGYGPKRLDNTTVERWSWPCVYVFVDSWKTQKELAEEPDQAVPSRLYLPDGRVVPTCVLLAPPSDEPDPAAWPRFPDAGPLCG